MTARTIPSRGPDGGRPRRRAGHTLIELALALAVYAVILGTMGLAIQLISRAHPNASPERPSLSATTATLGLAEDLRFAVSFSQTDPSAIEFTLLDRNGDGVDEKMSYAWSGVSGDPLLRTLNGNAAVAVVDDVHDFTVTYHVGTAAAGPLDQELALLRYHDDAPGGHFHDFKLEDDKWCGQYFLPNLPEGVTEWKIKRARIMAKREGDDHSGIIEVWITTANTMLEPTEEILDYAVVHEADLDDAYTWVDVDFTSLNDLDPDQGYCLVIAQVSPDGNAGKIPYNHGGDVMTAGTHWLKGDNYGASWSDPVDDKDMRFFIFGTYDNYVPDAKQFITGASFHLQSGSDPSEGVSSTVRIVNAPGVLP